MATLQNGVTPEPLSIQASIEPMMAPNVEPIESVEDHSLGERVKELLIGKPRDLNDRSLYKHLTLAAFLAWVGLGADGLSSSCYGPAEAFHHLVHPIHGAHTDLAIFLALATIGTVFVISSCYSHILEEFPGGGGGYLVASKLLGRKAGLTSGCALLVDYILTITVSVAAAGDAIFGLVGTDFIALGLGAQQWKLALEASVILSLIILNLRGIKESVIALMPIFLIFIVAHAALIFGAIALNLDATGSMLTRVSNEVQTCVNTPGFGVWGMLGLLLHAYSLGAGTYTGIEAVSNSMPMLQEPRVATAKRTMFYMATSLGFTAGGLMLAYLLLDISPVPGKTMNHLLTESFVEKIGLAGHWTGSTFVLVTMLVEGLLLFAAAQAGFIDGPRVLATMAVDSWVPHWFANLSERLTTHKGIWLMGTTALAALFLTGGDVSTLVIMYSINVFLTFSLSMVGMVSHWWKLRGKHPLWVRRLALFSFGSTLCLTILGVTVVEKFQEGGWRTLLATGGCIITCLLIRRYYSTVGVKIHELDEVLDALPVVGSPNRTTPIAHEPTACVLVGVYGGLGIHTIYHVLHDWRGYYKNVVFVSVGVVDSGNFKGAVAVDELRLHTKQTLEKYVELGQRLGLASTSLMSIGTDAAQELHEVCRAVRAQFPHVVFYAGQLVFQRDRWYHRLLHNRTAYALQERLHWDGLTLVILPKRMK